MSIYLSLAVALIGGVLYLSKEGKWSEVGRIFLFVGSLAFLIGDQAILLRLLGK